MLPKFRNVAVLATSVFLMRICCPNRKQDLVTSGSGLRHREEATQPHAQKRYGLSSLR